MVTFMKDSLSDPNLLPLEPSEVLKNLFNDLAVDFTESEVSSMLGIPVTACQKARTHGTIEFDYHHQIKTVCGVSSSNFFFKGIDYKAVRGRLTKTPVTPHRYRTSSYSSKHTAQSILFRFPRVMVDDALKFLQIDDNSFSDAMMDVKVSTLLNSDLLFYLSKTRFLTGPGLYDLGQKTAFYHQDKPFSLSFQGLSLVQGFSKVVEEIMKHFETSYRYELASLTEEKAVIKRFLSEKIKDEQHVEIYSNTCLCKFIQGSFSAVAFYSTGKLAHTTEEKCIFHGDSCCEFHVFLKDLRPPS